VTQLSNLKSNHNPSCSHPDPQLSSRQGLAAILVPPTVAQVTSREGPPQTCTSLPGLPSANNIQANESSAALGLAFAESACDLTPFCLCTTMTIRIQGSLDLTASRMSRKFLVTRDRERHLLRRKVPVRRRGSGTIISQLLPGLITKHQKRPRRATRDLRLDSLAKVRADVKSALNARRLHA
jgi:hypothetical protein